MRLGTLLAAALFVGACAGSGEHDEPGMNLGEDPDVAASMEVKVSGDSVRLILHVTNSGVEPVRLSFPTSQRYDFVIETPEGDEVWRWSDGMSFLQALSQETLAPGDSWDMEAVWDPGEREGEFVATGEITARERELRQRATFRL
jgi:hypothetical protein